MHLESFIPKNQQQQSRERELWRLFAFPRRLSFCGESEAIPLLLLYTELRELRIYDAPRSHRKRPISRGKSTVLGLVSFVSFHEVSCFISRGFLFRFTINPCFISRGFLSHFTLALVSFHVLICFISRRSCFISRYGEKTQKSGETPSFLTKPSSLSRDGKERLPRRLTGFPASGDRKRGFFGRFRP